MRHTIHTTNATTTDSRIIDSESVVVFFHSGKHAYRFEVATLDSQGRYNGGRRFLLLPDAMERVDQLLAARRLQLDMQQLGRTQAAIELDCGERG